MTACRKPMLWLPLLAVLLPLAALAGERPRTNFLLHLSLIHI